ncbi:MAG: alpha/beta hydrolase family protein [Microthrixaceae bacterium]
MGNAVLDTPGAAWRAVGRRYRDVERELARHAPTRALVAGPRTAKVVGETLVRRFAGDEPGLPVPRVSPVFAAQVAMDEAILAIAMGPNAFPSRADYQRVGRELTDAHELFASRGWLDDPGSYHRRPPELVDPAVHRGWALGQSYERVLFASGWSPRAEEPGAERWAGYEANRTASAVILRHAGGPRPWVIAVHGFGCGTAFMDFVGLHAMRIHRELGVNVALPVMPLHGPRKISRVSGEAFLSFDLMNTVHGLAQGVWDVRSVISWVRRQGKAPIGMYGVSLGGYMVSLLAGIEPDLDAVVAGIPVVDFPELIHSHSPDNIRLRAIDHKILGGNAEAVHRVVSPLSFAPLIPHDRRFVYGGLGDRLARPAQAHRLWSHWEEPDIHWYGGNHVGYLWSGGVSDYVLASLRAAGISGPGHDRAESTTSEPAA